jgi:hypothetical protein
MSCSRAFHPCDPVHEELGMRSSVFPRDIQEDPR